MTTPVRSVIVERFAADPHNYSDLQVLQSAAGFYVGTVYGQGEFTEPGSRDSDYFPTSDDAADFLDAVARTGDISRLRQHP